MQKKKFTAVKVDTRPVHCSSALAFNRQNIHMSYSQQDFSEKNAFILSRTAELRERIETVNGEIQQLDMDLEEHQG